MKQHLLGILLAVAVCFGANLSAQAQNTKDIVDRLNTSLGISLPSQYQTTVKNFVKNSKILSDKDAQTFTEQFIKDQMKTGWGINKQNQLLFIWDAVYDQITGKQLYTGEDGNQTRLNEFEKVMEKAEACGKKYKEGFKAYMKQQSAEARQQSAEARQQSAEARQQSAEARQQSAEARQESIRALNKSLQSMKEYYYLYKQSPNLITKDEINRAKNDARITINDCKRYNIDYKSKLSPEVRKFYGIE